MPEETIFWKAKVSEISSHGNGWTNVFFEVLEDNGMLVKGDGDRGILVFDETKTFPYKIGDIIELVMRLANE